MLTETILTDPRWEALDLPALTEQAARAALTEAGVAPEGFLIALRATSDDEIATLNADFRGKPQPTNVLSWPSEERAAETPGAAPILPEPGTADDPAELGDIALAYETCEREAQEAEKPLADHVAHLIVHGVLHLLGYDHIDDADAELMESVEVRALALMGLPDPY